MRDLWQAIKLDRRLVPKRAVWWPTDDYDEDGPDEDVTAALVRGARRAEVATDPLDDLPF